MQIAKSNMTDIIDERLNVLPLSMVAPGETARLVELRGGKHVRKRLADMGLTVGMSIRVLQGGHHGPVIVAVKNDTRLALGRGLAHHIIVTRNPAIYAV